jgi:hypothetical protein
VRINNVGVQKKLNHGHNGPIYTQDIAHDVALLANMKNITDKWAGGSLKAL